jgi:protein-S-isoprenylcysteine O-methyltransferase Ste14
VAAIFENPMWRFVTSGTLITLYLLADLGARRRRATGAGMKPPAWVKVVGVVSLLGFYLLIRPTGGARLGGAVNLAGIALALLSLALRGSVRVRHPDLAGRGLLYLALPLAVGAPWGLLVLSLPAWVTSAWCSVRAGKLEGFAAVRVPRYRLLPGIW